MDINDTCKAKVSSQTSEGKPFDPIDKRSSLIQKNYKIRYKLFLVFNELAEVPDEFFDSGKITLTYSFLGLEGKYVLSPEDFDKEKKTISIKKIKLYYFFGNTIREVNEILRQKDVIDFV